MRKLNLLRSRGRGGGGGGELVVARGEGSFSPFFLWPPLPSFHSCDLSSAFARPYLVLNVSQTKNTPKNRLLGRPIVRRFLRTRKDKKKDLRREHGS